MRILHITFLGAVLSLTGSHLALADPPPVGITMVTEGVTCDTKQNIVDIVTAGAHEWEAGKAKFEVLFSTKNDLNDPTCAWGRLAGEVISSERLPQFMLKNGTNNAWAVELKASNPTPSHPTYFILHAEKVGEVVKPSLSIPDKGRVRDFRFINYERPSWAFWDFFI